MDRIEQIRRRLSSLDGNKENKVSPSKVSRNNVAVLEANKLALSKEDCYLSGNRIRNIDRINGRIKGALGEIGISIIGQNPPAYQMKSYGENKIVPNF